MTVSIGQKSVTPVELEYVPAMQAVHAETPVDKCCSAPKLPSARQREKQLLQLKSTYSCSVSADPHFFQHRNTTSFPYSLSHLHSVCPSVFLSVRPSRLSVSQFVRPSVRPSIHQSVLPSVRPLVCMSISLALNFVPTYLRH